MSRRGVAGWAVLVGVLVGASVLLDGGWLRHRALAGPLAIGAALRAALVGGSLVLDLRATFGRALLGVVLGACVGVPLGVVAGRSRARQGVIEPGLDFLRAIPPLLVLPLVLFALGYGEPSRVTLVAWASALVVSLHVGASAAQGGGERERALRAMGATRWQRLVWLELPQLVPPTLVALRHAFSVGLVVTVVTEMVIGAGHGLGARAVEAQLAYDTPALYAVLLATGSLGWSIGRALAAAESALAPWRASATS